MKPNIAILALNSGSSSLKFALYGFGDSNEQLLARGEAENIALPQGRLKIMAAPAGRSDTPAAADDGAIAPIFDRPLQIPDHAAALRHVMQALEAAHYPKPAAIGHRIVNGGPDYFEPQPVTPELVAALRRLVPIAPLHLPNELKMIDEISSNWPALHQVACFDTAFHRNMPEVAQRLPLPRQLWTEGLRKYGFHGLSYEYIVHELGAAAEDKRVIIAHLGNGASLAAVQNGVSLDTTMGFTPTGGLIMGTRTGDLDPGVLIYLAREKHYAAAAMEQLVDRDSGLLGVSQLSSDMKILLESRTKDHRANQAVEMFCYSARKHIGALAAVLGGLDVLVFTAGIGERAAPIRREICAGLEHLGIRLDNGMNDAHARVIGTPESSCIVRVIATNEELMICRHAYALLQGVERQ